MPPLLAGLGSSFALGFPEACSEGAEEVSCRVAPGTRPTGLVGGRALSLLLLHWWVRTVPPVRRAGGSEDVEAKG